MHCSGRVSTCWRGDVASVLAGSGYNTPCNKVGSTAGIPSAVVGSLYDSCPLRPQDAQHRHAIVGHCSYGQDSSWFFHATDCAGSRKAPQTWQLSICIRPMVRTDHEGCGVLLQDTCRVLLTGVQLLQHRANERLSSVDLLHRSVLTDSGPAAGATLMLQARFVSCPCELPHNSFPQHTPVLKHTPFQAKPAVATWPCQHVSNH